MGDKRLVALACCDSNWIGVQWKLGRWYFPWGAFTMELYIVQEAESDEAGVRLTFMQWRGLPAWEQPHGPGPCVHDRASVP